MSVSLLVVPIGTITAEDRKLANDAGFCVIECEQPEKVRLIMPGEALHANDLTMAALESIQASQSSGERERFASILIKKIKAREVQP